MDHDTKLKDLVAAFPWGEQGRPAKPPLGSSEATTICLWLSSHVLPPLRRTALALIARIEPIVRTLEATRGSEPTRFVARLDQKQLTKSPASILEKMARQWDEGGAPPVGWRDIEASFTDLARFRVVTNFLSDADAVRAELEAPFRTPQPPLSLEQRALFEEFRLRENTFKDTIRIRVKDRRGAARSYTGLFEPVMRGIPATCIEVQIMTLLQESWDKKDHVLVYEPTRRGQPLPAGAHLAIESMSCLLFVVDETFDRLRNELEPKVP